MKPWSDNFNLVVPPTKWLAHWSAPKCIAYAMLVSQHLEFNVHLHTLENMSHCMSKKAMTWGRGGATLVDGPHIGWCGRWEWVTSSQLVYCCGCYSTQLGWLYSMRLVVSHSRMSQITSSKTGWLVSATHVACTLCVRLLENSWQAGWGTGGCLVAVW